MRLPVVAALLLSLVCACGSHAQISVTPKNNLGEPIIASTPFEGKAYHWRVFAVDDNGHLYFHGANSVVVDGGKQVYIWAIPGNYIAEFTGYSEEAGIYQIAEPFSVNDKPGPPGPEPKPISLRSLVNTSTATLLAEFYQDLASAVSKEQLIVVEKFWGIHNREFEAEWTKLDLPPNQQLTAAIKTKIDAAIGGDKTLEGDQRTKLIDTLNAISKEFGGEQPVPPKPEPEPTPIPVVGKIAKVVVLRESANETPELTSTLARLQSVGPDYEWFKREKIRVFAYDPQQEEANKPIPLVEQLTPLNPLPEVYLLTADNKVIGHMDLDIDGSDGTPATTAAQITEFVTRNQ